MENKNLLGVILLILALFGGGLCFVAGMKYQERQSEGFKLNIGDSIEIEAPR